MALRTEGLEVARDAHVVKFYDDDCDLATSLTPYLLGAIRAGDKLIVIATGDHRAQFQALLEAAGHDTLRLREEGALLLLDAAETLASIRRDGELDRDAFAAVIGDLLRPVLASGRRVSAYGEMVALLWEEGDVLGAIELEALWNGLTRELSFALYCSYRSASAFRCEHAAALHGVCRAHTSVDGAPDDDPVRVDAGHAGRRRAAVEASFPADPSAPGEARRLVVGALRERELDAQLIDDAALVVSELTSNAVRHAASPFSISVQIGESELSLAVCDRMPPSADGLGGSQPPRALHGLGVIDAIAAGWGVEATNGGKVVWATLSA